MHPVSLAKLRTQNFSAQHEETDFLHIRQGRRYLLIEGVGIARQDVLSLSLNDDLVFHRVLAGQTAALASAEHRCTQQQVPSAIQLPTGEAFRVHDGMSTGPHLMPDQASMGSSHQL